MLCRTSLALNPGGIRTLYLDIPKVTRSADVFELSQVIIFCLFLLFSDFESTSIERNPTEVRIFQLPEINSDTFFFAPLNLSQNVSNRIQIRNMPWLIDWCLFRQRNGSAHSFTRSTWLQLLWNLSSCFNYLQSRIKWQAEFCNKGLGENDLDGWSQSR